MSSKAVSSPTAALLRTSRLFSLPPPLPRPMHNAPDSATLPYPTHAALATPPSSLSRGDWGLKRPLPLRSTAETSTPTVRVSAVDSLDRITDFESAADHVLTLRKWQQLNTPLAPMARDWSSSGTLEASKKSSVFQPAFDSTYADPDEAPDAGGEGVFTSKSKMRWKFRGPWLAGMTEAELHTYINKEVRHRKNDFREYVRARVGRAKAHSQDEARREMGVHHGQSSASENLSDAELDDHIRRLRQDLSELPLLIQIFLDLPAISSENVADPESSPSEAGPPKTHPSAGLSYLRSNSFLENHPILGPQGQPTPVESRVLAPHKAAGPPPPLGVGGVVAKDAMHTGGEFRAGDSNKPFPRETKVWVQPLRAFINTRGMIKLTVGTASESAISIGKGQLEDIKTSSTPTTMPAQDRQDRGRQTRADLKLASNLSNRAGAGYVMNSIRKSGPQTADNKPMVYKTMSEMLTRMRPAD